MNAVVRALGFETGLRPGSARFFTPLGPTGRIVRPDVPRRAVPVEMSTADPNGQRAQVSIARACDPLAGGRKEPA